MDELRKVLAELDRDGLLLKQDKTLPNVVTLVTGESLSTSWWSHAKGRVIFRVLEQLDEHDDVVLTKLLAKKDTFVHRRLFPALVAVGQERAIWQTRQLVPTARNLLRRIEENDQVQTTGAAAKELLVRLLVHGWQRHTESGNHELVLETWDRWAATRRVDVSMTGDEGKQSLEEAVARLGGSPALLPWH